MRTYPSRVPIRIDGPSVEKARDFGNPLSFPKLQDNVLDLVLMSCTPNTPYAVIKQKHSFLFSFLNVRIFYIYPPTKYFNYALAFYEFELRFG